MRGRGQHTEETSIRNLFVALSSSLDLTPRPRVKWAILGRFGGKQKK